MTEHTTRATLDPATVKIREVVTEALDDMKAQNVTVLEVAALTSIMDVMVLASGTSDRHVKSLAQKVIDASKEAGIRPLGIEGLDEGQWVLVDLGDLVLHVMLPRVRDLYQLEKLWDMDAPPEQARAESDAEAKPSARPTRASSARASGKPLSD